MKLLEYIRMLLNGYNYLYLKSQKNIEQSFEIQNFKSYKFSTFNIFSIAC